MSRRNGLAAVGGLLFLAGLSAAPATAQSTSNDVVPFDEFIRRVASARSVDWVGVPGSSVSDIASFRAMRRHILKLYKGIHGVRSHAFGGQVYDCVPQRSPTANRSRMPAPPPGSGSSGPPAPAAPPAEAWTACGAGTVPMRRVTLEEMARLGGTRGLLRRSPGGGDERRF